MLKKKGTSYFTSIKKKLDNLQNISLLCKKKKIIVNIWHNMIY